VDSSNQIENISRDYVKLNSQSTITYLREIIQNKIQVVSSNLDILSNLALIKQQNLSAIPNLEVAQSSTKDLTEGYGWINKNGIEIWSSTFSENNTNFQGYANLNASERSYFKIPEETYKPFVSEAFTTQAHDEIPRIVIAYPILSLKPNTAIIPSLPSNQLDTKEIANQNQINTSNAIFDIADLPRERNYSKFVIQPTLYDLATDYLKANYEFKGIVTATINSPTLNDYISNALSIRNILNNTDDNNSDSFKNRSSSENNMIENRSHFSKPIEIEYSNILRPPSSYSSYILPFSFQSPSTLETLSKTLRPSIIVTDRNGIILFSSDDRIKAGSNYISAENLKFIENEYDLTTADFLVSVLHNLTSEQNQSYRGTLELSNKEGNKIIVNFEPILLDGKHIFYLSTNTKFLLSETANNLITNQIFFTFLFVGCLLFMVFSFIAIVLSINRKLKYEVNLKTRQLLQNVQELKLSNEKLIQSEEMEREFVNTAAHELRTPTQAITGYSELDDEMFNDIFKNNNSSLMDKELQTTLKQLYNHHEIISRNASRLETLINNLLDVARIESGISSRSILLTLHKEKIDLIKEINQIIIFQLETKIRDKNIRINFINNSLGEHCWVNVDKSRLNQILNNLIDNAIKFSKAGDSIEIIVKEEKMDIPNLNKHDNVGNNKLEVPSNPMSKNVKKQRDGEVFVAISDMGKGLSSTIIPKLFGKFMTDSDYGTGLGLYITKKLVEAHGGKIWAYNNKDGKGATFVFSLSITGDHDSSNGINS
jgi:signal transduction histidine kinase